MLPTIPQPPPPEMNQTHTTYNIRKITPSQSLPAATLSATTTTTTFHPRHHPHLPGLLVRIANGPATSPWTYTSDPSIPATVVDWPKNVIHGMINGTFTQSSWWFQPHLKNISQNGNLPQVGVKITNI